MKIAVPALLIFAGLAGLIALGVMRGGIPEIHVRDVVAGRHPGREVKVQGKIKAIHSEQRPLRFAVEDKEDAAKVIEVVADRTRPDTFQATYDVAVQGVWNPARGVFEADQIYTKCPSKYTAEDKLEAGAAQEAAAAAAGPE